MTTGWKLAIGCTAVVGITAYMAYLGGATSWQYYLTVDECLADVGQHAGASVRVSGRVAVDSLKIGVDRMSTEFSLDGSETTGSKLPVVYSGPLPDNLAEQVDVVVEGHLDASGLLRGEKILTRCASKYELEQHPNSGDGDVPSPAEATG